MINPVAETVIDPLVVSTSTSSTVPLEAVIVIEPDDLMSVPVTAPLALVRVTSLVVPPETTSVATIAPPVDTEMVPSVVSTSVKISPSNSSMVIEPVPLTLMFALTTVVSKSIPVVASAVNTSAVTSSLSSVPS